MDNVKEIPQSFIELCGYISTNMRYGLKLGEHKSPDGKYKIIIEETINRPGINQVIEVSTLTDKESFDIKISRTQNEGQPADFIFFLLLTSYCWHFYPSDNTKIDKYVLEYCINRGCIMQDIVTGFLSVLEQFYSPELEKRIKIISKMINKSTKPVELPKTLSLSDDFVMQAIDYAGQGNAILGIRDAGKTHTAMKAAEELLEAGIPIIVFDPIGIWKNLKIGVRGNKGYPIVVAGGPGNDILLTPDNATDIVQAAMKAGISLVIDLYSRDLINKSTWIKIVQETVDLLVYENEPYGMRHIFLEEAAEFIPQKLQPQHFKVYASLEKLARMGRNARLGYTLINQRAEEVNKAILEISALMLLHKQVGKNSINSIKKWLQLLQTENTDDVIKSLSKLNPGQCWAIGHDGCKKIQVGARKTFHPDPKRQSETGMAENKKMDVTLFVDKLNEQLTKPAIQEIKKADTKRQQTKKEADTSEKDTTELSRHKLQVSDLLSKNQLQSDIIKNQAANLVKIKNHVAKINQHVKTIEDVISGIKAVNSDLSVMFEKYMSEPVPYKKIDAIPLRDKGYSGNDRPVIVNHKATNTAKSLIGKGEILILTTCAQFPDGLKREAITVLTGYKRSSRDTYLQRLKMADLVWQNGERLQPTEKGIAELGDDFKPLPTGSELRHYWLTSLPKGESAILAILVDHYPHPVSRDTLTDQTGYASSSRNTYIQRMLSKEIVVVSSKGEIKASDHLFD